MPDSEPRHDAPVPAPPVLPEVDSPPTEAVLEPVPSTQEIIENTQTAEEILQQQPGVNEVVRGRH